MSTELYYKTTSNLQMFLMGKKAIIIYPQKMIKFQANMTLVFDPSEEICSAH